MTSLHARLFLYRNAIKLKQELQRLQNLNINISFTIDLKTFRQFITYKKLNETKNHQNSHQEKSY